MNESLNARLAMLDESHLDSYETFVCKTTILGALLGAIDPHERIVVVGGAEEVRPRHPHVVRLVARPATIEGAGWQSGRSEAPRRGGYRRAARATSD